jgi:8-oxo-dGTP pyrophosphatase MutT (NUDIX family)
VRCLVSSVLDDADALIAVAVVTSSRGVLLGRRRDGNPPWTFPGGKAEPGETPAEAAVRETAEETGVAAPSSTPRRP